LPIGAAGKSGADRLAHEGAGALAAGYVARLAGVLPAFGSAQPSGHVVPLIREPDQFGPALDRDPARLQSLNQQPLMLVLREDLQEGLGRQVRADRLERQARRRVARYPEV